MALSSLQLRGLNRLGDVVVPGDGDLPSFSDSGCAAHADRMLEPMYDDDRAGVIGAATACAFLPRPVIRGLLAMTAHHAKVPEPIAGLLRMANIGIKGVIMTLYYSDVGTGNVFEKMHWDPVVHRQDDPPTSLD